MPYKTVINAYNENLNSFNYLNSINLNCGGFQLKAVLSAFGKDTKPDLKSYLSIGTRITGFTLKQLQKAVITHGLETSPKYVTGLPDNEKIKILKNCIDKNQPVILAIGYGYRENQGYSKFKRMIFGHWISIWGYDDESENFLIYDSLNKKTNENKLPAGNLVRSYKEILRDWQGTFYFKLLRMEDLYLPIETKIIK